MLSRNNSFYPIIKPIHFIRSVLLFIFLSLVLNAEDECDVFRRYYVSDAEWFLAIMESGTLSQDVCKDVAKITYNRLFRIWYYESKGRLESINPDYFEYLYLRFRTWAKENSEDISIKFSDPLLILDVYAEDGSLTLRLPIRENSLLNDLRTRSKYQELVDKFHAETKIWIKESN